MNRHLRRCNRARSLRERLEDVSIEDQPPPSEDTPSEDQPAQNPPTQDQPIQGAPTRPHLPEPNQKHSVESLLREGLLLCGFTERRLDKVKAERNEGRFRGNFGVSSLAISKVVADLLEENTIPKFNLRYLFLTLFWLKAYPTYTQLEGPWSLAPETIAPKLKEYTYAIQQLKERKIKWFEEEEIADDTFIISVDGVHCRVQEVRKDPGKKWYSHKSSGAALSYELGIAIRSDRLVWMNGPFPASFHDVTIFRYGGGDEQNPGRNLKSMIPPGKRAIADSGYAGEDNNVITVTRAEDSSELKEFKARAKSRHETFNSRLKSFTILATEFRHNINFHQCVFESVCVLVQYDIENGHGLFEV